MKATEQYHALELERSVCDTYGAMLVLERTLSEITEDAESAAGRVKLSLSEDDFHRLHFSVRQGCDAVRDLRRQYYGLVDGTQPTPRL